jgi:predicted transcriptional regulator
MPGKKEDESHIMEKWLSSEIKLELLTLFHSNPGLIDKIDGIALRIGRSASEIQKDVRDLLDVGVLLQKKIGKSEVVCFDLTRDNQIQQMIAEKLVRSD